MEQLFFAVLDPSTVESATARIQEIITHPDSISDILILAQNTNNHKIQLMCSIQCFHALKIHWNILTQELQQNIFSQILIHLNNQNCPSHFLACIELMVNYSPYLQQYIHHYIVQPITSPLTPALIQLSANLYSLCLRDIDFSQILMHYLSNPQFKNSAEYKLSCISLLREISLNQSCEENQNYQICFHLFYQLDFSDIFYQFWRTVKIFIIGDLISSEDYQRIQNIILELLKKNEIQSNQKYLLLMCLTSQIEKFPSEFIFQIFIFCFQVQVQYIYESSIFSIDFLTLFEPFFDRSIFDQSNLHERIINQIYNFIRENATKSQEIPVYATLLLILNLFLQPKMIFLKYINSDLQFFFAFLINCLESPNPILLEAACHVVECLEDSILSNTDELINSVLVFVIKKLASIIISDNLPFSLRLTVIASFLKATESFDFCVDGIFNEISKGQHLFPNENIRYFIMCQSTSIRLDSSVTTDQINLLITNIQQIFNNIENIEIFDSCFGLLLSIIEYHPSIDFSFILPVIPVVIESKSLDLISAVLNFMRNAILLFKKNIQFSSFCYAQCLSIFNTFEESDLLFDSIEVMALAARYTANAQWANCIMDLILDQSTRNRENFYIQLLTYSQSIVKLLNNEKALRLAEFCMKMMKETDIHGVVDECLYTFQQLVKHHQTNEIINIWANQIISGYIEGSLQFDDLSAICSFISSFWPISGNKSDIIFNYLITKLFSFQNFGNTQNEEEEINIEEIVGAIAEAIKVKVLSTQSIGILLHEIDHICNISNTLNYQINFCYLLFQLLTADFTNGDISYINLDILFSWFQHSIENDNYSAVSANLSILFFEIYARNKNLLPLNILLSAISQFPPKKVSSTNLMLDSIIKNLTTPTEFCNNEICASLVEAVSKLLFFNEFNLSKRKISVEKFNNVKRIVATAISQNNSIIPMINQFFGDSTFQKLLAIVNVI
ncbi:hypothetical protein TRFO_18362 [Tritrichomonas foetus]|uniref:Importin N-terminal domain-containing protein n=1 Tax=Tritrichomonas foetus TaxID=1144522 RepID=A0A1J4KL73_9EUKA|nr:hypothetical protein TRFO_18362 [Tritrichomonas foetus]|eukprot:OHT11979.1 hypothetical protein TRFO_18362 [Tritrichomonas foetus]